MSEDLAHDAHLRAALRHAPDHALAPPSGLSQTILSAARQAHRPVRAAPASPPVQMRPAGPRPLGAWLRRLFSPRWAGAWAAGLVAALGLGLWLDLGVQPVIERPAVVAESGEQLKAAAQAEAAHAPISSRDAATGAVQAAPKAAPAAPARVAEDTTAAATPRAEAPAAMIGGERAALKRSETELAESTRSAAASPSSEAAMRHDAAAPQPATTGAVASAPAANRTVDTVAATRARAAVAAPAAPPPASATVPTNEQPTPASGAADIDAKRALRDARTAAVGEAVATASPALTLLRRAQAELASGSARWTWTAPGAATMAPFDDAAQAWLLRLVQQARGRWVDANERGEALDALEVRWWRDGWPHATLRIEAQGLRWIEPSGRIRYAPLDAATLQRLRAF